MIAAELFRRAPKALTITGLTLNPAIHELTNIDRVIDWGITWGERRKAAAAAEKPAPVAGNGFNGGGCAYSVEEIECFVREGAPAGKNRSETFHTIVGHYLGCGWDVERIFTHLQQFPSGIGGRYLGEGRLSGEIARSANKYDGQHAAVSGVNGWTNDFEAKAPASDLLDEELDEVDDAPPLQQDPELEDIELRRHRIRSSTTIPTSTKSLPPTAKMVRRRRTRICRRSIATATPTRARSRAGS